MRLALLGICIANAAAAISPKCACNAHAASVERHTEELGLDVWGEELSFAPLSLRLNGTISLEEVQRAASLHTRPSFWKHIARSHALEIVVLGGSVSSGCGSMAPALDCASGRSWVRHLGDWFKHLLPTSQHVRLHLRAKNAVMVNWFAHCTSGHVGPNADIVLIEFQGSMASQDIKRLRQDLSALVESVRQAAPFAVVVFIGWPREPWSGEREQEIAQVIEEVATTLAFDVLLASKLFQERWTDVPTTRMYYADHVHPNQLGHACLGEAVARFIALQLCRHCDDKAQETPQPALDETQLALQQRPAREWCFSTARQLPVAMHDGWELVDEGGAKGVKKEGYLSRRVGDSLILGPILSGNCMQLIAHIGYLQSWRSNQGAFMLRCAGCECRRSGNFPFPVVQTSTRRAASSILGQSCRKSRHGLFCARELADSTVTVSNSFLILKSKRKGKACFINLTHITFPVLQLLNESRVRIDSLSLSC